MITIAGTLALLIVVVLVGQLQGWWSDISRYLQGTASKNIDPSKVVLISFTSAVANDQVALHWETEIEQNNDGFDLYRQEADGIVIHVNQNLIPSQATESTGAVYDFVDTSVKAGSTYTYSLRSMDRYGFVTHCGSTIVGVPSSPVASGLSNRIFLPLVSH